MIAAVASCLVLFMSLVPCALILAAAESRQKHGGQNGDDGNDHQQLNQGKSNPALRRGKLFPE